MSGIVLMLMRRKLLLAGVSAAAVIGVAIFGLSAANAFDWSTPDACGGCHHSEVMPAVVADWKTSEHANSIDEPGRDNNDYCARCKSPFEFNPESTYGSNNIVPEDAWQGITCEVCHPPRELPLSRFALWDAENGEYIEMYDEAADEISEGLCLDICHVPPRHEVKFESYGAAMHDKKGVTCFDCHMPKVGDPESRGHDSHTWDPTDDVSASCGLERDGCHSNHNLKWAEKELAKGIHEKTSRGQAKDK